LYAGLIQPFLLSSYFLAWLLFRWCCRRPKLHAKQQSSVSIICHCCSGLSDWQYTADWYDYCAVSAFL